MPMKLDELRKLLAKELSGTAFADRTYFNGGCVRDYHLGLVSVDFDLCVELPHGGVLLAQHLHNLGLVSKPVYYAQFGTAMVYCEGLRLEFIQTRRKSYREKGQASEIEMGSLADDVQRRDFTINSLMLRVSDGIVLDLTGLALSDIEHGIIRCIQKDGKVFRDDPLRLMRAVRLACELGFGIAAHTWLEMCSMSHIICKTSQERVATEMNRILLSQKPALGITLLSQTGILREIMPEFSYPAYSAREESSIGLSNMPNISALDHCSSHLTMRWAALLQSLFCPPASSESPCLYESVLIAHDCVIEKVLTRFKIAKVHRTKIHHLMYYHHFIRKALLRGDWIGDTCIRLIIVSLQDSLAFLMELLRTDSIVHPPDYAVTGHTLCLMNRFALIHAELTSNRFELKGYELMTNLGIESGIQVGLLLKTAKEKWLESPKLTKQELLEYLQDITAPGYISTKSDTRSINILTE